MRRGLLMLAPMVALAVLAGWAIGGIEGSKHDFGSKDWNGGDSCGVCHAPHRSEPPKGPPLWDPQADLSQRFGGVAGGKSVPGFGTLSCLRCHDGTVAGETATGSGGARLTSAEHPGSLTTGHGATDHPVGVPYPLTNKYYQPSVKVLASGAVQLPGDRVECVSCHDPHNEAGLPAMLVMSNARSALCLTCHKK